jgi:hypothetical protein
MPNTSRRARHLRFRERGRTQSDHSFLFKNTPNAWHGVSALTCPTGSYRRLFNIIFEGPAGRRLLDRARTLFRF